MSGSAVLLLATFEPLPPEEQHELLAAMLRRSGELPETFVSDDALLGLADSTFQALDAAMSGAWALTDGALSLRDQPRTPDNALLRLNAPPRSTITHPTS